jgi:hypothetical protein
MRRMQQQKKLLFYSFVTESNAKKAIEILTELRKKIANKGSKFS